jgi:predicted TIM-barrel fold metal-dependent hydrolase
MVIDAHAHLFPSEKVFQKSYLDHFKAHKMTQMSKEAYEKWSATFNGRVETLIKDMDEAGVDRSVALPTIPYPAHGEPPAEVTIWEVTEYVADAQKRYPDRIIGLARIDPLRKDALALLDTAITKWGLRGVKIHPTAPLTDGSTTPVLNRIQELGVPILFHMGVDPLPFLVRNGDPRLLDALTAQFPALKMIAAHHARGFEQLLTAVMLNRAGRIYSDLSLWQQECAFSPWKFLLEMRYLLDRVPRLILMGSDWPWVKDAPLGHKAWFDAVRNLKVPEPFLKMGLGMRDFSDEEKRWVLGENAQALFKV